MGVRSEIRKGYVDKVEKTLRACKVKNKIFFRFFLLLFFGSKIGFSSCGDYYKKMGVELHHFRNTEIIRQGHPCNISTCINQIFMAKCRNEKGCFFLQTALPRFN